MTLKPKQQTVSVMGKLLLLSITVYVAPQNMSVLGDATVTLH